MKTVTTIPALTAARDEGYVDCAASVTFPINEQARQAIRKSN